MSNNGWPLVPFGELMRPNKRPYQLGPTEDANLVGMRLYGLGPFHREFKAASKIQKKSHFVIRENDVIYNKLFAWKGTFGIVPPELDGMFVSDKFPTYELDTSRVDRDYLRWYFRCPPLWEQAREMSTGSAALSKLTLNPPRFLDLTIPLPSPDEQRRIVARIDRLAAKIDEANEMNRRIDVEIAALSASLHFSISKDRRVPMNSLIELSEDRVPVEPSLSYPQVGIRGFGGGLFGKPPLSGGDTTYRHFNRLSGKMLVLSQVKGWDGAIGVCPQELAGFFASPEYRTFQCIEATCDPEYLDMVVRAPWFRAYLQEATHGQGARRERTRPEQFLELVLPMPELEDQKRAARVISKLKSMQPLKSHVSAARSAMLPSILDRAFKGAL
jgi:type I restriction enzyme S subunit